MQPLAYKFLKPAVIKQEHNSVYSDVYQDFYFNTQGGAEESHYVFVAGNDLTQRWSTQQHTQFCIAETGFGSGLNFLSTCLAWHQCQQKPQHLHFISTELHPIPVAKLQHIHQQFPQLQPYAEKLIQQCGSTRAGFHRLPITSDITLTLILGDAVECFKQLTTKVDAWFLDGFAPNRNPEMWRIELFQQVASLSKPGTTFATFSAAAVVRNGLSAVGFKVLKRPGFGQKRDMLVGEFQSPVFAEQPNKQPWHPLPTKTNSDHSVTIVGGGIAGMCLAKSFHQSGYHTTIIDQHSAPLQQASGNGYAMTMPLVTAQKTPEALLYLRAFEYAQQVYATNGLQQIGVMEIIQNQAQQHRAKAIKQLSFPKPLLTVEEAVINYPKAGYIDTHVLVNNWLKYINLWLQAEINTINHNGDYWQLFNHQGHLIHQCKTLVIASGMASQSLIKSQQLQLTAKLGQTHQLKTATSLDLDAVLLNQGYIIPINNDSGHYLIGATFDHVNEQDWLHSDYNDIDHLQRNLQHWQNKDFYEALAQAELHSSHVAVRATTPDHLPICGPVINEKQFKEAYQDLHHGRHWQQYPETPVIENLYVLTGLGSRGFTSAPLLAEYLKSMILGEPLPLEVELCKIIHPNRFNYRLLKKGQKP